MIREVCAMRRLGSKGRSSVTLLAVVLAISVWLVSTCNGSAQPPDGESIQQGLRRVIDFLDSPDYAELISWDEHVVLAYKLSQWREPTALEFFLLRAFREDIGMKRSTVLSVALRGKVQHLTWAQCRVFLSRVEVSDFRVDSEVREIARRLAAVDRSEIIATLEQMAKPPETYRFRRQPQVQPPPPGIRYKTYFGYLHAHSELSEDGEGSPNDAYIYAHVIGGLDFFALTDHGEFLDIWPWEDEWEELVEPHKPSICRARM
jgi:hypothetical protein